MRAKLQITSVTSHGEPATSNHITASAVTSSNKPYGPEGENEDNTFARYTPNAQLSMTINNPNLVGKFRVGQKFYVDFTETE